MAAIELHTRSTYSDGTFAPAELIAQAEQIGAASRCRR